MLWHITNPFIEFAVEQLDGCGFKTGSAKEVHDVVLQGLRKISLSRGRGHDNDIAICIRIVKKNDNPIHSLIVLNFQ